MALFFKIKCQIIWSVLVFDVSLYHNNKANNNPLKNNIMKAITDNYTCKDLKTREESVIYNNGKPIYRAYEKMGTCTHNDIAYFLRVSNNYSKY